MLNLIGAYIISILLLGILFRRPSFVRGEEKLRSLSNWFHYALIAFLAALAFGEATDLLSGVPPISLPNFVLSSFTYWVHEAGHVYWGWGGEVLHSLGGTINEIIFPLLPAMYAFYKRCDLLAAVFLFWLGHNCFGISVYVADASAMALPLPGGGTHDWNIILSKTGLLERDQLIAKFIWWFGALVCISSLVYYLLSLRRSASETL